MRRHIWKFMILCALLLPVLTGCGGGAGSGSVEPVEEPGREPVATTVWQQVSAPVGGIINVLAVDPNNHLTLYAATQNSGVFKSTNGGASWSKVNKGLPEAQVNSLAVDPSNSQTIYAGTGSGVYKSTNAAASWSPANNGLEQIPTKYVLSVSIDSTDSRIIFAGCGGGVYKSSNAGESWSCVYRGGSITSVAVAPGNGQVIYAGTTTLNGSDVLKSGDGGRSWQTVNYETGYIRSILVDATNSSIVYVSGEEGFFKSIDGGNLWFIVHEDRFNDAATAPSDQTIYALIGESLSSSSDRGIHWKVQGTPFAGMSAASLVVDPENSQTIYVGTYGAGVFKSTDGGVSWSAVNRGLSAIAINAAVIADLGGTKNIFVGTQSGIFRSADAGATWSGTHGQAVNCLAVDHRDAPTLYAGRDFGGVYKSGNGGESWSAVNEGLGSRAPDSSITFYPIIEALAADPTDGSIYAGTYEGIYKSSNGGDYWSATGAGVTGRIFAFATDPARKGTLYVATFDGISRSVDGGATWTAVNAGFPEPGPISSLVIDPSGTGTLYAGRWDGVYKSTDGANFWTVTDDRTFIYPITALAIDPVTKTLYAGTRGALYQTADGGSSWSSVDIRVADPEEITAIAVNGPTLCAVTNGGAVFVGRTSRQ